MFLKVWLQKFWSWYDSHETFNTGLAGGLFLFQLVHLYWMTTHVVFFRLFGESFFNPTGFWKVLIVLVDYTEVPAIILTSLVYVDELRKGWNFKSALFLVLLNSQWIHLFWITDEVVLEQFTGVSPVVLPIWLSWIAIGIDYLELPVIFDTLKKFAVSVLKGNKSESKSI